MKYDITKPTAPKMPTLGKGTECIKLLLSQASKDMYEPLVPMFFPVLGAHISGAEFQYPDLTWKEMCGQMANLMAKSGDDKQFFMVWRSHRGNPDSAPSKPRFRSEQTPIPLRSSSRFARSKTKQRIPFVYGDDGD